MVVESWQSSARYCGDRLYSAPCEREQPASIQYRFALAANTALFTAMCLASRRKTHDQSDKEVIFRTLGNSCMKHNFGDCVGDAVLIALVSRRSSPQSYGRSNSASRYRNRLSHITQWHVCTTLWRVTVRLWHSWYYYCSSEWVSSLLTADEHILCYLVPYHGMVDLH